MLNNLFNKRKQADEQRKKWERATFIAGVEWGRKMQRDIDNEYMTITGLPSAPQIESQIEEILKRMGV